MSKPAKKTSETQAIVIAPVIPEQWKIESEEKAQIALDHMLKDMPDVTPAQKKAYKKKMYDRAMELRKIEEKGKMYGSYATPKRMEYIDHMKKDGICLKSGKALTAFEGKNDSASWNVYGSIVVGILAVVNGDINPNDLDFQGIDKPSKPTLVEPEKAKVIRRPKK